MTKKKVNVSEKLISSFFIGFIVSVLFVFTAHLLHKKWRLIPIPEENGQTYLGSKVESCYYQCVLGSYHNGDCGNLSVNDVSDQKLGFGNILSATFDGHGSLILSIGLIASILIYIFKKYNFNIVEE